MKMKKLFLVVALMIVSKTFSDIISSNTDEVVIDLNNNKLTAEKGIAVKSSNINALFYELEREPQTEIFKFSKNALINIGQSSGNIKIEAEKGSFNRPKEKGEFFNNFAYINVGKSTGAEAPNDRIYFGSPYIKYEDENIYVKKGWLTTDFKILNFPNDPKKAGYHLLSEDMLIEPDKQITFKNTDLYVGQKTSPFSLPWFRANIRKDSLVPLFPTLKLSGNDGLETSWGILYGKRKDKFRGGFAPKFTDRTGVLIGRWENWYKTDDAGELRLNMDDLLVYSKVRGKDKSLAPSEYEKRRKKYRVTLEHNYAGEKGNFNFKSINSSRSMVSNLRDVMQKFDDNKIYKTLDIDRHKFDKNIGFYNLNADLKELGEAKDLSFKANMNIVSDKKAYGLLVYDSINDITFESNVDHDLYSNFRLDKENEKIKIEAKYNYLYDMDPGSTKSDLKSRDESVFTKILDKKTGLELSYDKRQGDDYRNLDLWEKDIKTVLKQKNVLGVNMNYTPITVSKYSKNDYENVNLILGKHEIGNYLFKPSISYSNLEKKLDLTKDNYRKEILGESVPRILEYNRFDNRIYEKYLEKRVDFTLVSKNENEKYNFAFGKTDGKILDREGLFDGKYREYENSSKFYEILLERKNIETNLIGVFDVKTKVRQDKFKDSSDKLTDFNVELANKSVMYKNNTIKITNKISGEIQKYNFSGNAQNKEQRLIDKDTYFKIGDKITINTDKFETEYDFSYKNSKLSYGKKSPSNKTYKNELTFNLQNDKKAKLFFDIDKKYTNKTSSKTNTDYLNKKDYGISLENKNHKISFSNMDIDFNVKDFKTDFDSKEKINQHKVEYSYKNDKNKLTLSYSQGKDSVIANPNSINKRNREYSALYSIYGDVEHDIYLGYGENYYGNSSIKNSIRNTDVYKFSYEYKDKRFEKEELIRYATLEYEKPKEEITVKDVENIRNILEQRKNFYDKFELTRIADESFKIGNYKKNFKFYLTMEKNKKRYSQSGNLRDSLSKLEGGLNYTYNRVGVGYKFKENADWKNNSGTYQWAKKNREHEFSTYAKIGKPSEGWKIKTYAKIYDNLEEKEELRTNRKKSLDGVGIEIGKEMGYYEWGISYENKYNPSTRNYEWRAGVHFTLLTFPNDSLFGFGTKDNGSRVTRPDGYIFDRPSPLNR